MMIKNMNSMIKSIYEEIDTGYLDLRPNFQRGEVWSLKKKKLLIDSILREWYVPPIHTVSLDHGKSEVLDGQQRLTAIRDFMENQFSIDGTIEPKDEDIYLLNGKKYKSLPPEVKIKFERFIIVVNEITQYNQGEPNELFYRLNQTVKLTSSEARNAIFGEVRDDISSMVIYMEERKLDKNLLGFSNSRMAYNDLLSRVCLLLEKESIRYQLSDSTLTERFRLNNKFNEDISSKIKYAIDTLAKIELFNNEEDISANLTKASSLNWMYIICCIKDLNEDFDFIYKAFINLEVAKTCIKINQKIPVDIIEFFNIPEKNLKELLMIYIERSSSRVMSIGSIIIRDIIQSYACYMSGIQISNLLSDRDNYFLIKIKNSLLSECDVKSLIESVSESWKEPE
ncbi:DUF262 domain-containing protein [Providencia stuartii]